jgi:putative flippase GtrA
MVYMAHQARFAAVMTAITRRLPFGLSEVVAPSLVGYLLINLCTFFIDLALLGLFHGTFRWPIPVAVTLSYGTASGISYVLNRILNFRSHENVGRQFPVFAAVSASNYLIFVLGLTDLLSAVGVYYELSRVIAACCEAVYLYCMMRWVVFRDTGATAAVAAKAPAAQAPPPTATAGRAGPAGTAGTAARVPAPTAPEAATEQAPPPSVTAPPAPPRSEPG